MPLESGRVFNVMAAAYRHGVLDRFMGIFGEVLEGVMAETGAGIGDVVNKMDEARESTVAKLDSLLSRSGPLLKAASGDRLMETASRLLDSPLVRRVVVRLLKGFLVRAMDGEGRPPFSERALALAAGFTGKGAPARKEVS